MTAKPAAPFTPAPVVARLVRATCTDCGDIEVTPAEVTVRVCEQTGEGWFVLRCPTCRMTEVRDIIGGLWFEVQRLVAAGSATVMWSLPAELSEPVRHDGAPRVSPDDVLDFHLALQASGDDGWLTEIARLAAVRNAETADGTP